MEKKRIRDFGIVPGRVKTGKRNAITDVPGVLVGHCTVNTEENHTGVTVIIPGPDNAFANHYTAAAYVHNGFGKSAGTICYGMKGGIGSASRVICIGEKEYITYFFCASLQSCRRLYQMGD